MDGLKSVDTVNIVSWPGITLEVSDQFHVLLWFVLIMSCLLLIFCTLITGAIVAYGVFFLMKNKLRLGPWDEIKRKLCLCIKRTNDDVDAPIITSDILYEANQEIEQMDNISLP